MPAILFILVLALVIFGPKRLPEVMRQVAKFLAQFRVMRDDLKRQIQTEMLKIEMDERQKQAVTSPPPSPPLPVGSSTGAHVASPPPAPLDGNVSQAS